MNKVFIIGRITKDIELRYTQSQKAVASFTLAVNRDKENADFIPCVAWDKTADLLNKYTGKGSQIAVTGRIQTGSYTNKDGKKVSTFDVVADQVEFLGKREEKEQPKEEPKAPEWMDVGEGELPWN